MKTRVPEDIKSRVNVAADALGVTLGEYIGVLVQQDALDDTGRPLWADAVFGPSQNPIPGVERTNAA